MSEGTTHRVLLSVRKSLTRLGIPPGAKILAGVSGGMDSMVLLHILHQTGYMVAAAHVNFNLRGAESTNDALFVRKWTLDKGIPFYELSKDTKRYATDHNVNIQVAARDIRYAWWEELVRHHAFDFVATAHHLDDTIETLFLNLLRGTGMKGLTGIPLKRDSYIRPLLDCSRREIASYAEAFDIPYRADESNETDHYQRNKLRHHLIPMLEEMYPGMHSSMRHTLQRMNVEWEAWKSGYEAWKNSSLAPELDGFHLAGNHDQLGFQLRWLEEKGIPWLLAYDFLTAPDGDSGTVLTHHNLSLYRTGKGYFLEETLPSLELKLPHPGQYNLGDFQLNIEHVPRAAYDPSHDGATEYMNEEVVQWPLEIRSVLPGDRFQPIGMHGHTKKIQDFLVDLKMEMHEKERQLLLTNREHILWVVGLRLDERAKIDKPDGMIYRISFRRIGTR